VSPAPARLSLRAFAKLVGVTDKAVRKAIASGRLVRSVGRDDRGPFVRDAALARREWGGGAGQVPNSGGKPGKPAELGGDKQRKAARGPVSLVVILSRNKSPFYKKNHQSEDEYKKFQSRSKSSYIEKYGKIEGEIRHKIFLDKVRAKNNREYLIKKHGKDGYKKI